LSYWPYASYLMLNDWKKRRDIKRKLDQIYKHYEPEFTGAAKTSNDYFAVQDIFEVETADLTSELEKSITGEYGKRQKGTALSCRHGVAIQLLEAMG
jgi:hypothetical protein